MLKIIFYLFLSDMGCCGSRSSPPPSSSVRQFSITSSGSGNDITFINNTRDDITYITAARLDTVEEVEEVREVKLEILTQTCLLVRKRKPAHIRQPSHQGDDEEEEGGYQGGEA